MSNGEIQARIDATSDSNDRHRSRARSVATLSAAAAGALAAGLILTPEPGISKLAQTFGFVAIVSLIIATSFCASASISSAYEAKTGSLKALLNRIVSWRVQVPSDEDDKNPFQARLEDAQQVEIGIARNINIGLVAGTVAVVTLIISLSIMVFEPNQYRSVTIDFKTKQYSSACPALNHTARAEMREQDVTADSTYVSVKLSPTQCGNTAGASINLPRSEVTIAEIPAH